MLIKRLFLLLSTSTLFAPVAGAQTPASSFTMANGHELIIAREYVQIQEHFDPGLLIEAIQAGSGLPDNDLWLHANSSESGGWWFTLRVIDYDVDTNTLAALRLDDDTSHVFPVLDGLNSIADDMGAWFWECWDGASEEVQTQVDPERMLLAIMIVRDDGAFLAALYHPATAGINPTSIVLYTDDDLVEITCFAGLCPPGGLAATGDLTVEAATVLDFFDAHPPATSAR